MSLIRSVLENQVLMYQQAGFPALLEQICLKHGKFFEGRKRPKGVRKLQAKQCFRNSVYRLHEPGMKYYEGFVMHKDIHFPHLHAWNTLGGKMLDLTLPEPELYEYIGLDLTKHVWRELAKNEVYGLLDPGIINIDLLKKIDETLVVQVLKTRLLHSGRPTQHRPDRECS